MNTATPASGPVTPADVRAVKFQLIRRGGYDPSQVDPFLEVVAQTLEGGPHADERIDGQYVHGVRFTTVRRGGYLPAQVDAFLDRVIDTFNMMRAPIPSEPGPAQQLQTIPAPAPPAPVQAVPLPDIEPPLHERVEEALAPPPVIAAAPPPPPQPEAAPLPAAPAPQPQATAAASPLPTQRTPAPDSDQDSDDTSPEADFERLRILHRSGVVSDKEFAVLGARVKRRIVAKEAANVG